MNKFNGEKLKSARIYRGYNVSELSEMLNLQRQTVSMYENGKIKNPDFSVVKNMSDVLGFPPSFFLQQDTIKLKYGSIYFRSLLTTDKKYRNQQIERVKFIAQIYKYLNEYLDFPKLNLPEITEDITVEEMAMKLRLHWNLGEKPIENIIYLAEQNGIIVVNFKSQTGDVDAFSQIINDENDDMSKYIIGYSKNKGTASRIHFDISHELGHILMHEWSEDIEALPRETFKEKEEQAHAFASAFLLPAEAFVKDLGCYGNNLDYYKELKKKWKVSISAMIRRAYNLDLISYQIYQNLNRAMQKYGIKKEEPLDNILITSPPSALQSAIQILLENNILTPKEILNELSDEYHNLSLSGKEIEDLLSLPPDTLKVAEEELNDFKLQFRIHKS